EHGEQHGTGAPDVAHRVERGSNGATGLQHVIDEDDDFVVDALNWNSRRCGCAREIAAEIVAVHRDVERSDGAGSWLNFIENARDALSERHTSCRDAQDDEVVPAMVR